MVLTADGSDEVLERDVKPDVAPVETNINMTTVRGPSLLEGSGDQFTLSACADVWSLTHCNS